MKNLLFILAFVGAFLGSCTPKNYVNIPRQKFDYYEPITQNTPVEKEGVAGTKLVENQSIDKGALAQIVSPSQKAMTTIITPAVASVSTLNTTSAALSVAFKRKVAVKIVQTKISRITQKQSAASASKTNKTARLGGILGLVSLALLLTFFVYNASSAILVLLAGAITSLVSVVLSFVGKKQIKQNGDKGMGWVITGIISGIAYLLIFGFIVWLIFSLH